MIKQPLLQMLSKFYYLRTLQLSVSRTHFLPAFLSSRGSPLTVPPGADLGASAGLTKHPRHCRKALVIAIAALLLTNHSAKAQSSTPTHIIVPFPAGGAADILARTLAEEIGRKHQAPMVVENRPGSGTVVATEAVARAAPDGKTLLVNANSFVINSALRKLSYDPLTSFEPICYLAGTPMFIVVASTSPYRTLLELLAAARSAPGQLTLASLGPATAQHIAVATLKRAANVDILFVPYPGNVPAITALLGGHVTSALGNYPEIIEHVRAGRLRALATTVSSRVSLLPDVPTVAELGFSRYEAEVWLGLVAPVKTPQEKTSELASWILEAMRAPEIEAKLSRQGLFQRSLCGAQFAAHLRAQSDEYHRIVRDANIKAD
jgi:tripartite-type tricarboxylate transporter receptor subunit TctC